MDNQLIEDLTALKDYLARVGWTKGEAIDSKGRCCLEGGILFCLPYTEGPTKDRRAKMEQALAKTLDEENWVRGLVSAESATAWKIVNFNDRVAKSFADVSDLINRTIEAEKNR